MPDNLNNGNSGNMDADILSHLIHQTQDTAQTLKGIESLLKQVVGGANRTSASNARNQGYSSDTQRYFQSPHNMQDNRNQRSFGRTVIDSFANELFGKDVVNAFNKQIDDAVKEASKSASEDIAKMGSQLGQTAFKQFASTEFGKGITSAIREGVERAKQQGGPLHAEPAMPDVYEDLAKSAARTTNTFNSMRRNANNASSSVSQFTSQINSLGPMFEQSASALNLQQSMVDPLNSIADWMNGGSFDKFSGSIEDLPSAIAAMLSMGEQDGKGRKKKKGLIAGYGDFKGKAAAIGVGARIAGSALSGAGGTLGSVGSTLGTLGSVLTGTGAAAGGVAIAGMSIPYVALIYAGYKFQQLVMKVLMTIEAWIAAPTIEAFGKALNAATDALARNSITNKKNVDLAKKRLEEDVNTLVKAPFEILTRAAEEWYKAWDANLRVITATQGYNKADVQALAASFSERLRKEGLSDVVSSSLIIENLSKVLQSGLSGIAAEEFAYVATILGETIPTQDFFGYADEYSSIVANLVNLGVSQEQAISEATAQLTSFANNLLYASRATGGLTTGLKDAEGLFRQSVQISQTSKSNDTRNLSGLLTTVAAVTGALAPDLASAITEAVYNAATGGNASNYVALRSLAGINASNTEFLKELSDNPQKVFGTLFENLAQMQNMSPGAFMEVSEGLAEVFGVPMSALARIDFNTLADAIKNFNVSSDSLEQNLNMLKSGETTTSAESLKIAQINKMIVDEGLAYVLDNEAARAIQQHMWDEQRERRMQEATYGVNLQGAALDLLQGISSTIDRIMAILSLQVFSIGANNLIGTINEAAGLKKDIQTLLNVGKVGRGNKKAYGQLTTYNQDFNLMPELVQLMGGNSMYGSARAARIGANDILHMGMSTKNLIKLGNFGTNTGYSLSSLGNLGSSLGGSFADLLRWGTTPIVQGILGNYIPAEGIKSKYTWGSIGKSSARALGTTATGDMSGLAAYTSTASATAAAQAKATQNVERMLSDMEKYVNEEKAYEEYLRDAKKYGLSDVEKAMEEAGYSMSQVEAQYKDMQAQNSINEQIKRQGKEVEFWETNTSLLSNISSTLSDFLSKWEDYFINHSVYNSAYTRESVDKILQTEREQSESAIYALADALTENDVKLLLDPTVQTNALLAQILKVANAILNQQGSAGGAGVTLPDTLAGLSLGMFG